MATELEKQLAEALRRIADPRNTHFAGDAQVVASEALAAFESSLREHAQQEVRSTHESQATPAPAPSEQPTVTAPLNPSPLLATLPDGRPAVIPLAEQPAQGEREAFEAWCNRTFVVNKLTRWRDGYEDVKFGYAWDAWQARAAIAAFCRVNNITLKE